MNIFVTSECPEEAARYLDDKRLVKMVLETAQILSTVGHIWTGEQVGYRPTHKNHPCVKWAAESKTNFVWLLDYFIAIGLEYEARYNRKHKSSLLVDLFSDLVPDYPWFTERPESFVNCTIYKDIPDVTDAYKLYLNYKYSIDKLPAKCTINLRYNQKG